MNFKSKLAQQLIDGADADIWYDAAEHGDGDAEYTIDTTQDAMVRAAKVLDGYSHIHDVLSDAIENPVSTHDGRLALLPIDKDDYQGLIETLAMLAGMNPPAR